MPLALAYTGRSHMDALLVSSVLEAEGLHPVVPGSELVDDFSTALKRVGGMANVYVPEHELTAAREILDVEPDPALVGALPHAPLPVPVYSAPDATAAVLMKGLLEAEGLMAWSPAELDPKLAPEVWVFDRDRERALEILDAWVAAMRPLEREVAAEEDDGFDAGTERP